MHTRSEFTQETNRAGSAKETNRGKSDLLWTSHLKFLHLSVSRSQWRNLADRTYERRCHDRRVYRKHHLLCGQSILFEGISCVLIVVLVAYRGLKLANAFSRLFDSSGPLGECGG